jgi:DNA repair photolyase
MSRTRIRMFVLPNMWLGKVRVISSFEGRRRLPILDERQRGTKFVELPVKSVINSPESTGMGFWSINPYVGCEFGCTYCYARYAHRYVVERAWDSGRITEREFLDLGAPRGLESFEQRIFVKSRQTVLHALEHDLRRMRSRTGRDGSQTVLIGTATDPYQPAERQYQVTRAILTRLRRERGLRIGLITKSPLICRDIDLLKGLSRHHLLSVYVSLMSADAHVIDVFEARSPMPHVRLRALWRLSTAGVRTGLIVAPILPGITDSVKQVRELLRAAKHAGARFIRPVPLRLYPATRERYLPLVEQHFPRLTKRYQTAYANRWDAPQRYAEAVQRRFSRIAGQYGIPDSEKSEAESAEWGQPTVSQLSLFAGSTA